MPTCTVMQSIQFGYAKVRIFKKNTRNVISSEYKYTPEKPTAGVSSTRLEDPGSPLLDTHGTSTQSLDPGAP